jgi:hypothetical protein
MIAAAKTPAPCSERASRLCGVTPGAGLRPDDGPRQSVFSVPLASCDQIAGRRGRNAIRDDRADPFATNRFAVDQTRVLA